MKRPYRSQESEETRHPYCNPSIKYLFFSLAINENWYYYQFSPLLFQQNLFKQRQNYLCLS